jgi:hypothetical protein
LRNELELWNFFLSFDITLLVEVKDDFFWFWYLKVGIESSKSASRASTKAFSRRQVAINHSHAHREQRDQTEILYILYSNLVYVAKEK